jgi:hypothetical protein
MAFARAGIPEQKRPSVALISITYEFTVCYHGRGRG